MADSLSHSDQPAHGTNDRHHRYSLSRTRRRNRAGSFCHSRRILSGYFYDRIRIYHRFSDTDSPPQRRRQLPCHRKHFLSGHLLPHADESGNIYTLSTLFRANTGCAGRFRPHCRSSHRLYPLASIRIFLFLYRCHVQSFLCRNHTNPHTHAELC